ncbi:MAG: hypothetical protein JWN74_107 [Acidobacteriaceae bacterium]|jgi:hypothetical protein|nr:hypothetical protein [Acidobacteriaceae bacterium]
MTEDGYMTFEDVAERMQSRAARIYPSIAYENRCELEGTSLGFYHYCEWFEINIHNAKAFTPEDALKLLQEKPGVRLDNSDTDKHNVRRWFGGGWIGDHHVRVWYNPQAF